MNANLSAKSGSFTYTTTGTATAALTVDTRGCGPQGKMLIMISNGSGGSCNYQINGYPSDSTAGTGSAATGQYVAIKAQTPIAQSTVVTSTDVDKNYAAVVLLLSQNSGSSVVTVDWMTY